MKKRQVFSLDEFKRRALAGKQGIGPGAPPRGSFIIRSGLTAAVEPTDDADRRMSFAVATAELNRNGWRLNPDGWKLENYVKNPVMLWGHDDARLPVAKAEKTWVDGDLLKVTALFTPAGMSSFNDAVYEMYRQGFLSAVSAGWIPLEWDFVETDDGWEIMCAEQELVEISFVPVPAEPNALRIAAAAGIDVGPIRQWAARVLGEPRFVLRAERELSGDEVETIRQQFANFYPGAKLLILLPGASLAALDELQSVKQLTQAELAADAPLAVITAGVVPRNVSTELADENAEWSAPTLADFTDGTWEDLSDAEKRDIAGHFAWAAEMPPAAFGSLKLPHHRASDGKVVWRGVSSAMGVLLGGRGGVDIPDDDREKVYNHLAAHYRAFEKEPPEYREASVNKTTAFSAAGTTAAAGVDAPAGRSTGGTLDLYRRRIEIAELE